MTSEPWTDAPPVEAGDEDTAGPATTRTRQRAPWLRRWAEALVVALLLVTFVATTVGIEGRSMAPSLLDGDRALVPRYETWAVRLGLHTWHRDDVVYFRAPSDTPRNIVDRLTGGPFLIKRVVATGGQTVELRHGTLLVDAEPRDEPFTGALPAASVSLGPTPVPAGHLFVLGDNRAPLGSRDSRAFGPIAVDSVAGRAAWVVWPLVRIQPDGTWAWNVRRLPRRRRAAAAPRHPSAAALAAAVQSQTGCAPLHRLQHELHVLP